MKTLTTLFTLLLVSVSVFAEKNTDPKKPLDPSDKVAIVEYKSNVKLFYLKENEGKVRITIYDMDGNDLGHSTIKEDKGFIQPLNFSGLDYGQYTLKIEDKDGITLEKVNHLKKKATIESSVYDINNTNRYRLSVNNKKGNDVLVKVYNKRNEVVHEQTIENTSSFSQVIDLSKTGDDKFTFQVSNGTDSAFEVEK